MSESCSVMNFAMTSCTAVCSEVYIDHCHCELLKFQEKGPGGGSGLQEGVSVCCVRFGSCRMYISVSLVCLKNLDSPSLLQTQLPRLDTLSTTCTCAGV